MMTGVNNLKRTVVDYFFVFLACTAVFQAAYSAFAEELYGAPVSNIGAYLDNLIRSYPDWIASRTDEYLSMKNAVKFAISDHKTNKTFNELIEHPDVDDMFYVPYPAGSDPKATAKEF
jgi:hypothetical protein